jgi:hypothetical protein
VSYIAPEQGNSDRVIHPDELITQDQNKLRITNQLHDIFRIWLR